jgi:hypothetical protein
VVDLLGMPSLRVRLRVVFCENCFVVLEYTPMKMERDGGLLYAFGVAVAFIGGLVATGILIGLALVSWLA